MRATLRRLGAPAVVFSLAALSSVSTGCAGIYVELQGSATAGKFKQSDAEGRPQEQTGSAYAIGFGAGFDFDVHRSGRFAVGYTYGSTSFGDTHAPAGMLAARGDF